MTETTSTPVAIGDYFPMAVARERQTKAMDFVTRAFAAGYRDVVVAAPTGVGKSALGAATCLWAVENGGSAAVGGYYLVTQKLLQDQLEHDFSEFIGQFSGRGASVKSSSEYACPTHVTCMIGRQSVPGCLQHKQNLCRYRNAYGHFAGRAVAVTNYPYFMTERSFVKKLPERRVMVLDECHSIERQILNFVDVSVGAQELSDWAPYLRPMPAMPELEDFRLWLAGEYLPILTNRHEFLTGQAKDCVDTNVHKELQTLENHRNKVISAVANLAHNPENWVYWQEQEASSGELRSIAKPIDASPYVPGLLHHGTARLYMSAYPGPKKVFCRTLGLDPGATAWCSLSSDFPVENRPIHLFYVGSMGRENQANTLPGLMRMIEKIMTRHADEKGIVHVGSYRLGSLIQAHLAGTEHALRILYPFKAHQRETALREHSVSPEPTVILSPSMTEGFSLNDDLARWQVIAKVQFPYLGDRQVAAKREHDPEWYAMQAAMSIVQACGRIVRSSEDWGSTYILDSDFENLLRRHPDFFPNWFQQAFIRH